MIITKDIRNNKGITMVSLIITIVVMFIISSITIHTSLDRFEINKYNKMVNDIKLLSDKVRDYHLKYNGLPVMRDSDNNKIKYTYTSLEFDKNINDNSNYYILDLGAMEGITLNYGEEGYKAPNTSKDVYIINENSHQIYYVKGIELKGIVYYTSTTDETSIEDEIPPSKPKINVISGEKDTDGAYFTDIKLEFVPGIDKISDIEKTTYSVNGGTEEDITTLTNNQYIITTDGTYEITLKSYDAEGNYSELAQTIIKKTINISLDKTEITAELETDSMQTMTLTATTTNLEGDLTWKSSDVTVASISGDDNLTKTITLRKPGTATITVNYGSVSVTCNITVTDVATNTSTIES